MTTPDSARSVLLVALLSGTAACAAPREQALTLEVSAGDRGRLDSLVEWELPESMAGLEHYRLTRIDADIEREVAVQVLPGTPRRLVWIVAGQMRPGDTRRYRLSGDAAQQPAAGVEALEGERHLTLRVDGVDALRYQRAPAAPPEGVDAVYARSGYIHPVWTPSGRVVTGDFAPSHPHQHGVFFAWTRTAFEERPIDFWNSAARQGSVECLEVEGSGGGQVLGWFRARQLHTDLTAADGAVPVLEELWEVRVHAAAERFVIDLTSVQSCAGASPLEVLEYHYGGMALRGPVEWEGDAASMRTDAGLGRVDGNATRARWCSIWGPSGGATASVTVMAHPANLRAPQPVRLHPQNPYFCFAPCQDGPFEISPDRPLRSRYRFIVADGPPDPEHLERAWGDYERPLRVRVTRP